MTLAAGALVAERFEIEEEVGRGAAEVSYRGRDRQRDQPILLRLLLVSSSGGAREAEDFIRGAEHLARLRHPGLESYVAHGRAAEDLLFLATEWVAGEPLAARQRKRPLRVGESLGVVRAAAAALGAAHAQGVSHGGLWPGALLLPEGSMGGPDVIVTGLGRTGHNLAWTTATGSGHLVEGMHYVAPEQVRGLVRQSPAVDVFALGCMLFECLTGATPFAGRHAATVLAQILFQEAPPLRQLRPELPESLAQLVGRMLSKSPTERPADGQAVAAALDAIVLGPAQLGLVPGAAPVLPSEGEQQLVCLVLARPLAPPAEAAPTESALGSREQEQVASLGGHMDRLADGSLLVVVPQTGHTATDLAAQAARVALLLRAGLPGWEVALVTGRGMGVKEPLVAEALRRAFELLERRDLHREEEPQPGPWLDELTARLLDPRFHVQTRHPEEGQRLLVGERSEQDEVRSLLGTVTPCLGRERELELLLTALVQSVEEPMAQALLVLAPSGTGKSRLRQEFVRRAARRLEERGHKMAVWIGRGDPMRAGTAYGLLAHAVRERCGIPVQGETSLARAQLAERVSRHLPAEHAPLVVEFLGELCGLPADGEASPRMRAARQDPQLMSEQVKAAFVSFLRAECAQQPVLLVLEDLHWSDAATVRLVETALRELEEEPLVVLALARPEVKERFPRLWASRRVQELRLQGLGKKASHELIALVLGARATPELNERIVTQAGGNALFLEELIRAAADDHGQGPEARMPETVLAMLQARLGRLSPMARRLLRAGSLFGDSFWGGGVYALLGGERHAQEIERALEALLSGEVLVVRSEDHAKRERLFAFRHSLLRDAAYSLMTEEDRRLGHRLVAAYLERSGERDPVVLGEHYRLGGKLSRAALYFAHAARQALEGSDLEGTLERIARGVACGARGELLATLRTIEAQALLWQGQFQRSSELVQGAIGFLPEGSEAWLWAQGVVAGLAGFQGQNLATSEHLARLARVEIQPGAEGAFMEPAMMAAVFASTLGRREMATHFLERMQEVCDRLGPAEARAHGLLKIGALWHGLLIDGDVYRYCQEARAANEDLAEVGDRRFRYAAQTHYGVGLLLIGEVEPGRALCQGTIEVLLRKGEPVGRLATRSLYTFALAETGGPEHAAEVRSQAEEVMRNPPHLKFWLGLVHAAQATIRLDDGDLEAAEQAARQAIAVFQAAPAAYPMGYALLGRILLGQGRLAEAAAAVEQGFTQLAAQGGEGLFDTKLHLAAAEIWRALGQGAAAEEALATAARKLAARAHRFPDEEARRRFLERSRERRRLQELGHPMP
ncbi:MAG TPA: AAA family ATPase [Polyangia bacterium]|nr:AAA family ATPase [Polyangia bacterium]